MLTHPMKKVKICACWRRPAHMHDVVTRTIDVHSSTAAGCVGPKTVLPGLPRIKPFVQTNAWTTCNLLALRVSKWGLWHAVGSAEAQAAEAHLKMYS